MGFVYLVLILAIVLLPMALVAVFERAFGFDRRRLRAARAWGLGLRRSGPWFWRVGGL